MATADEASSFTAADTSEDEVVETLVAGRQKRSTAGKNMSSLLDAAADDDLTLLFAEDENDDEFDEDEGADGEFDDLRLDSSSEDEDDHGTSAADDDLEGEKELETQARVERKKRKAQESLRLTALRKKVKMDSPAMSKAPNVTPRPKKKSERVSWLPTPEEGPVRSSSRRQTMQNKELTHARLKDSEQRRIKLIATMEEAAKRKQRTKPKIMTQEERLAEAEKIERLNSRSLNRWEEMEKRKAEERKAKLEALQNRRLQGPVMSWWSGIAMWVNGKLIRVGNVEVKSKVEKEEIERKKKLSKEAVTSVTVEPETKGEEGAVPATAIENPSLPAGAPAVLDSTITTTASAEGATAHQSDSQPQVSEGGKATSPQGFLDGIHQYASLPTTPAPEQAAPNVNIQSTSDSSKSEPAPMTDNLQRQPEADKLNSIDGTKEDDNKERHKDQEEVRKEDEQRGEGTQDEIQKNEDISTAETHEFESPRDVLKAGHAYSDNAKADEATNPEVQSLKNVPRAASEGAGAATSTKITETEEATTIVEGQYAQNGNTEDKAAEIDQPVEPAIVGSTLPSAAPQTESADTAMQDAISAPVPASVTNATSEMNVDQPASPAEFKSANEIEAAARPEDIEKTGRNLLVLENFDNSTMQDREFSIYFNAKKPPRLTKIASHLCPITSQLSRYRDPDTGLPYANVVGYQEIRNLTEQKYIWSGMLGCYIGSPKVAAKGVPEQFLTGIKPEKKQKEEDPTGSKEADKGNNEDKTGEKATTAAQSEAMEVDES